MDHNHFCKDTNKQTNKQNGTFSHKTRCIKFVSWHLNFIIATQIYFHHIELASVIILTECQKGGLLLLSYLCILVQILKKNLLVTFCLIYLFSREKYEALVGFHLEIEGKFKKDELISICESI